MVIAMFSDPDPVLLGIFAQAREALAGDAFSANLLLKIERARRMRRWRRGLVIACIVVVALMNVHLVLEQAMHAVRWAGEMTPTYTELLLTPWGWAASMLIGACVVLRATAH
jgi:hypothetical protein